MGVAFSCGFVSGVEVRRWLGVVRGRGVPRARRGLVRRVSRAALVGAIENNPVDTARARAAWVADLEQLGGAAPAGWEGSHPESAAIAEGRDLGDVEARDETQVTEIAATNRVDYINYLEYGTRRMSPFEMVRRSLQKLQPTIPLQPFFAAGEDELGSVT